MTDLTQLRKLAEAATPGPWHWDADAIKGDPLGRYRAQVVALGRTITKSYYTDLQGEQDAAFIAAANPTVIIELLDLIDTCEKQADHWQDEAAKFAVIIAEQRKLLERAVERIDWLVDPRCGKDSVSAAITEHLRQQEGEKK